MNRQTRALGFAIDDSETFWISDIAEVEAALERSGAETLKLIGDWQDLGVLRSRSLEAVRRLWIRGESIRAVKALRVFRNLNHLMIESNAPPLIDFSGLGHLSSCNLQWKDLSTSKVLNETPVSRLAIVGVKGDDFTAWPSSKNLQELTLTRPALSTCRGLELFPNLGVLDIRLANRLHTLSGVSSSLESVSITNAPRLASLDLGDAKSSLRAIRLFEVSADVDLAGLYSCSRAETVVTGGKRSPVLNWPMVLKMPALRRVQGLVTESFEDSLQSSSRTVESRQEFGPKTRRWVDLMLR